MELFVNISASRGLHQDKNKKEICVSKTLAQYIKYKKWYVLIQFNGGHASRERMIGEMLDGYQDMGVVTKWSESIRS